MVIVDAYNVLMTEGSGGIDLPDLERLAGASRFASRGVVLVCDGVARGRSSPGSVAGAAGGSGRGVRVVQAGPGREADAVIEAMLEADSAPRRLLVVSDDRRLKRAARRSRAGWLGSLPFLARLREDEQRSPAPALPSFATEIPLDRASVAYWMRQFGLDDEAPAPQDVRQKGRTKPPTPAPPPTPATPSKPRRGVERADGAGVTPPSPPRLPAGERIDPVLLDALEEWAIGLDELDMRRWLDRKDS